LSESINNGSLSLKGQGGMQLFGSGSYKIWNVGVGNHRVGDDVFEGNVRQRALGCAALPFCPGSNPSELITGFFFISANEQLAQVSKLEMLSHFPAPTLSIFPGRERRIRPLLVSLQFRR